MTSGTVRRPSARRRRSLVVWLPEKRASYLENLEQSETMGRMFGQAGERGMQRRTGEGEDALTAPRRCRTQQRRTRAINTGMWVTA